MDALRKKLDRIHSALDYKFKESYTGLSRLNPKMEAYFHKIAAFHAKTRYPEACPELTQEELETIFRDFFLAVEATADFGIAGRSIHMLAVSILDQLSLRDLEDDLNRFIKDKDEQGRIKVASQRPSNRS